MRTCALPIPSLFLSMMIFISTLSGCSSDKIWVGGIVTQDDESEVEKGKEQHGHIVKQVGVYNDAELSRYVEGIGEKIAATSDRPKLLWHFTVLDTETPNAFATQGGYIYITRGMLALLQSDTELAAILAHEIAHICTRDTPEAERVGNMMGIGVLGVLIAAPALILFPQVAAAPAAAGMASVSRKNELNADKLGMEYLRRAGYPPESMSITLSILASMEAYGRDQNKPAGRNSSGWWHRVYASHPTTETRQEKLTEITTAQGVVATSAPQSDFVARLDRLEIGSSKFDGIPYKEKRYFTQWKIALEIPKDWSVYMSEERGQLWLVRLDGKARLEVEKTSSINLDQPCETLHNLMTPSLITESHAVIQYDLPSCSGLVHKSTPSFIGHHELIFRAGVIAESKTAGLGYVFRGYANSKEFSENDRVFLSVIRSIEPITATGAPPKPYAIHVRRVKPGETFASIANGAHYSGKNLENMLRLINRRYPTGEPVAGELIKIIQ